MKLYITQIESPRQEVVATLNRLGWRWRHVPLRSVTYLDPSFSIEGFDGVILSSKYAATWLVRSVAPHHFGRYRYFVVGNRLLNVPGMPSLGPNDLGPESSAQALVKSILDRPELAQLRILFPCGETRMPTMEQALAHWFKAFKVLEVYSTVAVPHHHPALPEERALFFAPSAVEDYHASFGEPPGLSYAIGSTTFAMMRTLRWQRIDCVDQPDWTALIKKLNQKGAEQP